MAFQPWDQSPLWKQIQERTAEGDAERLLLQRAMPEIERVLRSGGTSPKDFTLHDEGHSFRVARRMVEIIPPETLAGLSAAELALLLLSAYLHDIGMTPEWGKVAAIRNYLMSEPTDGFPEDELDRLRQWLAEREGVDFAPPVSLHRMEELATYYCRARHNDWSAQWIREHMPTYRQAIYPGWMEDLILICQSHHFGYEELAQPRFDPRDRGAHGVIHRRYLAAALRVADVLENDPERTPEVILHHRSITRSSEPYWLKDSLLNATIEGRQLTVSAYPTSALLHKAIEETVDQIESEFVVCHRLDREHPFADHPVTGKPTLPHRWSLDPFVIRKVQPEGGRYEYIEGAFRPSTGKLLDLLTGRQLYLSYLAGVRELLQNAFDAVKEQIARTQLLHNKADAGYRLLLARQNEVTLRLEVSAGRCRLICRDTGVGMSKPIIKDYLLVSGEWRNPDLVELQLKCKAARIPFERVGQFGIGVPSYFMLGDHVTFRTRRSAETGTEEARGWEFETWGVGSFGELRQVRIGPHGTEVEIELRPEAVAAMASLDVSPEDFYGTLREYVSKLIVVAPCRFELTASVDGCKPLQIDPGWVTDETRMAEELVSGASRQLRGGESESAMTCTELDNQRGFEEVKDRHLRGLRQSVQFCGQVEGDLPDGLGRYRIILPYFALPDKSLVYLFLKKVGSETPDQVETAFGFQGVYPTYRTIWSWRGLECDLQASLESPSWFPCWVSVNLTHGLDARMPVHRDSVTVPDELLNRLRSFMEERVAEVHSNFLDSHRTSLYARLSAMVTGSIVPKGSSAHWAVLSAPNVWKWTALRYPTVARMDASRRVAWQGEECSVAAILKFVGFQAFRGESNRIDAFGIRFPCQRVVLASPFHFIPMWTVAPSSLDRESGRVWLAEFPKSQRSVLGCWNSIAGHGVVILNRDHPLSALARSNSFEWINRALSHGLHTRGDVPDAEQRAVLLQDKNAASDWMIACSLNSEADAMWKIVHEQDPSFWPVLWAGLAIEGQRNPIILLSEFGHMLIQRDAIVEPKFKQLAKFLPGPSPQDCLQYIPWKKPRKRSRSKLQ